MPRLIVVCDSNLYRSQGATSFSELVRLEAAQSVIAFASYFVVTELLAHLADTADASHAPSWAALRRLWSHCKQYDGSRELLRFVGDSDAQVPYTLFGAQLPGRDDQAEAFGHLIGRLVFEGATTWPGCQATLTRLRDHVRSSEGEFVAHLFEQVVQTLNPSAASWGDVLYSPVRMSILDRLQNDEGRYLVAQAIAANAAHAVGQRLNDAELKRYGQRAMDAFPVSVAFYDRLVQHIIRDGVDMSSYSRPNSLWDYQITFSTGHGARILGRPVWLVTNDGDVLRAAGACGTVHNIKSLDTYRDLLQLPVDDFSAVVAGR